VVTKLGFMVGYTTFLVIFIQFMGMLGDDLNQQSQYNGAISGYPSMDIDSDAPVGLVGASTSFFNNVLFFFELMRVDSGFWWIGSFVLTPFVIGVSWSLLEIVKDIIPFT